MQVVFHAGWLLPIDGFPQRDGYLTIEGDRIVAVGETRPPGPVVELGEQVVLPGLVNAHTHLEFSTLQAPLGRPGMPFSNWIGEVVAWRRAGGNLPQAAPPGAGPRGAPVTAATTGWMASDPLQMGREESLRDGVTLLGNIFSGNLAATPPGATSPDVVEFQEVLGWLPHRREASWEQAQAALALRPVVHRNLGLSPHAPYTVHPDLLAQTLAAARQRRWPVAMHLAESPEELQLLRDRAGPMVQMLEVLGAWRPGQLSRGTRPLDYLRLLAAAPRSLVIHGNYLDAAEIAFAAEHARRMSVVYCPRTHAYFGHSRYPLAELLQAGALVALGTDSRGSNPDLSLLNEMRCVARLFPELSPRQVIELGTRNGAEAIGYGAERGTLTPGKLADLVVLPLPVGVIDPYEAILASEAKPSAVMHRGQWMA